MDGIFLARGDLFASIWKASGGHLLLLSKHSYPRLPSLIHAGYWSPEGSAENFLKKVVAQYSGLKPLNVLEVRENFPATDREVLSLHLLAAQSEQRRDFDSIVAEIAWRSVELVSWGEPSVAKLLAEEYGVPIRTMHSRLRLARERKLISSPGSGERLQSRYEPNMLKILE